MNTLENNKIIAEFMKVKFKAYNNNSSYKKEFTTYSKCQDWIIKNKLVGYKPEIGWKQYCGFYHKSYNELMPVCKKIIELYKIKSHKLELSMLIGSLNIALMNLEIEKIYECAINCIKWYNEQNK